MSSENREAQQEALPRVESRHEQLAVGLVRQFEELGDTFGAETLQSVIRALHDKVERGEVIEKEELTELFAEKTPRQEFQEAALGYLEKDGFVSRREDGMLVVDAERLMSDFRLDPYRLEEAGGVKITREVSGCEAYGRNKVEFLANAFDGVDVVLGDAEPNAEAKPLFYLPKTRGEALDIKRIREADFHFGLWEIPDVNSSLNIKESPQPTALDSLSYLETSMSALIWHPRYGAGQRKDRGRLIVQKDGKSQIFSGSWLSEQGFVFSGSDKRRSSALREEPVKTMYELTPEIIRRGVLRLEDFRVRTNKSEYETESNQMAQNGSVSFSGVRYNFGRAFVSRMEGKRFRIEKVGEHIGGVVELDHNDVGTLVATFNLYQQGDEPLLSSKTRPEDQVFYEAGVKETSIKNYTPHEFQSMRKDEGIDDLRERVEAMDRFQKVLNFDNALKRQNRTRLRELPRKEIDWIRQHPDTVSRYRDDVLKLTQDYGREGLELVALVADIPKVIPEVKRVLGQMTPEARRVFLDGFKVSARARREAIKALETAVEEGRVSEMDARKLRFDLGSQMGSLVESSDTLSTSRRFIEQKANLGELRDQTGSARIFAQMFRDAFKGAKTSVDFEAIRGLHLDQRSPAGFSDKEREEMLKIFDENWADQDQVAAKGFRADLERGFDPKNERTHFYVLKKDGKVGAFIRFDHRDDLEPGAYYAGSFNVREDLRGSAIGDALMDKTLEYEAEKHVLYAQVLADAVVGTRYVENGLIITGVSWVEKDGKRAAEFNIRQDNKKNKQYRARRDEITREKLMQGISGVDVHSFDYTSQKEDLIRTIEEASKAGKVITRYWVNPKDQKRYIAIEPEVSYGVEEEASEEAA